MAEHRDYRIRKLKCVRIMNISLDFPIGKWHDLTAEELKEIHRLLTDSDKTYQ